MNLDNEHPTECLNEIIRRYNKEHGTELPLFSREELIARIISQFDGLYKTFVEEGFSERLKKAYYARWLHTNQKVEIQEEQVQVEIKGINEFGHLVAQDVNTNTKYILEADGNSFDIMKNLIYKKI